MHFEHVDSKGLEIVTIVLNNIQDLLNMVKKLRLADARHLILQVVVVHTQEKRLRL